MTPIRDFDLWRRIDRALEFHSVECCMWHHSDMPARKAQSGDAPRGWSIAAALAKVSRGLWGPISALRRPTFTRAA